MVFGHPLKSIGSAQQFGLCERRTEQLQPNRQIVGHATWNRDSRNARKVGRHGVDVRKIHREGVVGFFAESERDLERLVHSCGFYRRKARALRECCRAIARDFGGEVPRTREALVRLSGVGDKTANVVLNGAFGQPAIAVDTHVLRTSNRLGWARTRDPRKAEAQILEVIPKRWWKKFSLIMIAHGRRCCAARKPDCPGCPVLRHCPYGRKAGG